jgi:hypothetical protein
LEEEFEDIKGTIRIGQSQKERPQLILYIYIFFPLHKTLTVHDSEKHGGCILTNRNYPLWTKVFGHFEFSLFISNKTSFSKYYFEINSCPILIIFSSTETERYVL